MISWCNWDLLDGQQELHRFTRAVVALRKANPVFGRAHYFRGKKSGNGDKDIVWFSPDGLPVDWAAPETPVAYRIDGDENDGWDLYLAFNNTKEVIPFVLPKGTWHECLNTGRTTPHDIVVDGEEGFAARDQLDLRPKAMAMLRRRAQNSSSS